MISTNGHDTATTHWFFRFSSPREIARRITFFLVVLSVLILSAICLLDAVRWVGKPFAGFFMNRRMVVSSLGVPDWSGIRAGLRPADQVVLIEGRSVASIRDMEGAVNSRDVAAPIRYTVKRGEQVLSITAPTMRFSISDLLMTFGIPFLQGVVFLVIGMIVFILKPDSAISWIFLGGTVLQSISSFIDFDVASTRSPFSYLLIFCDSLNPALVLHFSAVFPLKLGFVERRPALVLTPYVISALLFLSLVVMYPGPQFYKYYFAVIYPYTYLAIFSFLAALSFSYFKNPSSLAKQRARVIFWGALTAFPLPLLAAVILNSGLNSAGLKTFTNFTTIPLLIFPVAIAYSITRHNLFDVDVYIQRAVGYGIMTAVVGATYLALQVGVKSMVFASSLGNTADYVYPVLFALLVVFLFNPINRRVQESVDRIFFRRKFNYKEAVISISDALSAVLNLDEIVQQINAAVRKEMFIDTSGLIVLDPSQEGHRGFFVTDRDGAGNEVEMAVRVANSDPLVALISRERKLITKYDIAEDPRYAEEREVCAGRFAELGATLAIPMMHQGRVNAVITVGRKKSGRFFAKEDIELLTTLASHGAVSIENAKLAEQMKKEEIVRTNLSRYLSPQIVEGIVKSDLQVNLGGARKAVTVLFSDIRNFTSITESHPPDQLVRVLNEYFTGMAEVIFANRGSLDKYIGDAIVAVFGSLIPLENPEAHAVQAAIGMMHRLEEVNRLWQERGDFTMSMGIGINTGEVFLGNIGSAERMEFTVIGDAVNVASRFSSLAHAGQILITKTVMPRLGPDVLVKEHPPTEIKGKSEKLEVYEVVY